MEVSSKICSKCMVEKDFKMFHKNPMGKYGYKSVCMECTHAQRKERFDKEDFPELRKKWAKEQYLKNKESILARTTEYRLQRPDKYKFYWDRWASKNKDYLEALRLKWRDENKPLRAQYSARYRSRKLKAIPKWVDNEWDKFLVDEIYELAQSRSKYTGIPQAVDHIVPLYSDIVCGLHCPDNLRVISFSENSSKSNRYWPDMP